MRKTVFCTAFLAVALVGQVSAEESCRRFLDPLKQQCCERSYAQNPKYTMMSKTRGNVINMCAAQAHGQPITMDPAAGVYVSLHKAGPIASVAKPSGKRPAKHPAVAVGPSVPEPKT